MILRRLIQRAKKSRWQHLITCLQHWQQPRTFSSSVCVNRYYHQNEGHRQGHTQQQNHQHTAAAPLLGKNRISIGNVRTHIIFGCNTDVGKSVISTGLVRASLSHQQNPQQSESSVHYLKPLQSGGSDQAFVESYVNGNTGESGIKIADNRERTTKKIVRRFNAETLFQFNTPTSPHLASRLENLPVSDDQVYNALSESYSNITCDGDNSSDINDNSLSKKFANKTAAATKSTTIWIETAGGVLSPSTSSPFNKSLNHAYNYRGNTSDDRWGWITQADLYQPLQPLFTSSILIGDNALGGISATLTALESLWRRNYHIAGIIFLNRAVKDNTNKNTANQNADAIKEYILSRVRSGCEKSQKFLSLSLTENSNNDKNSNLIDSSLDDNEFDKLINKSIISLPSIPSYPEPLDDWYESKKVIERFSTFNDHLLQLQHGQRQEEDCEGNSVS